MKVFELSKFQIFVNKCVNTNLNIANQLVVTCLLCQLFFEARERSHIKMVNELTCKIAYTFFKGSDHFLLKILRSNERMLDRESEGFPVFTKFTILRKEVLCVPFFLGSPSNSLFFVSLDTNYHCYCYHFLEQAVYNS